MTTVEKSQADIRASVMRYLDRGYSIAEQLNDDGTETAVVTFERSGTTVRIEATVPAPDQTELRHAVQRARSRSKQEIEHGMREVLRQQTWAAIAGSIKARLHAVDRGVSSFEQAFLADIVSADGRRTVFEALRDAGDLPALDAVEVIA